MLTLLKRRACRGAAGMLAAATLLSALSGATQGAASTTSTCAAKGSGTLAADAVGRVYRLHRDVYVCAFATGKRVRLDSSAIGCLNTSGCFGLRLCALSGRFVAYTIVDEERAFTQQALYVRDLTSGQRKREWIGGVREAAEGVSGTVDAIVLSPTGHAAWISELSDPNGDTTEVHVDRGAGDVVIDTDTGNAIGTRSLGLAPDGTVFWTHESQPRSASINP